MTKILNFALKIKGGGGEGGTCEVLRPCHPPPKKNWNVPRVFDSLSFYFYIVILAEDPVNPSLNPGTCWYGWRYLSLYHYSCYI